jgi:hypothetical protein
VENNASPCRRARLRLCTLIRGWPWYYETAGIFAGEVLLRAIPNARGYLTPSMGKWSVSPYAFEPNKKRDIDGMSFFREDFVTPFELATANKHPARVRVARVSVAQFRLLGLEVRCAPDETQLPGHAIVPEMSFIAGRTREEKRRIADLSQKLAQFASENKTYCPPGLPPPIS